MHPARQFRDDALRVQHMLIENIAFGQVFVQTGEGPCVAHVPILASGDDAIRFHVARTNPMTNADGSRAIATLTGPDAYISARWYAAPDQVPTWNYTAIELVGPLHRLPDSALEPMLVQLTAKHEAALRGGGVPWTMGTMSAAAKQALLRGIVGFELQIEERRETVKLAQHKPAAEREHLIAGLEREGDLVMADAMRVAVKP